MIFHSKGDIISNGKHGSISNSVIKRLPRYYRFLGELLKENIVRISSRELSQKMKLTASQIRQDLNCFGGFGQQGYGYNVEELHNEIGKILGVDKHFKTILIGAGNLGRAIATHINFETRGCHLIGIFDVNPALTGVEVAGIRISHTSDITIRISIKTNLLSLFYVFQRLHSAYCG